VAVVPSLEVAVVPSWEVVAVPSLEVAVVPSWEVEGVCRPRYHPMEARTAFEEIGRRWIVDRSKEKVDL
jgi:hypothetical protein